MIDAQDMAAKVARLEKLLARKFGAETGPLAERLRKVGRDLPKSVRRDVQTVIDAAALAGNPRLSLQGDPRKVAEAFDRAVAHLEAVDVKDRRRGRMLTILGAVMFNLLAVFILLVIVLRWRGLV